MARSSRLVVTPPTPASPSGPRDPWAGFAAGVLGGVAGGLLLLSFAGIFLRPLAVAALIVGLLVPPRPFGAAGTLAGWGATWALVLLAADARCDAPDCLGPDLTNWLIAAGVLVAGACALLVIGIRRRSRRDGPGGRD
jgi:hypothetical protein